MKLTHLSDEALEKNTLALVREERELLTRILHHLLEIDRRRLFSKAKLPSLFSYAMVKLGYTEDQAAVRISAMRLLRDLPGIEDKISSGALNLTKLSKAQTLFNQEKKGGVGRSAQEKVLVLEKLENLTKVETEKCLRQESLIEQRGQNGEELKFFASDALLAKLKRLREIKAHSNLNLAELVEQMADLALAKWDPVEKAKRNDAAVSVPERVNSPKERYVRAEVRHALFNRDQGKCQKCGSAHAIEIDHYPIPFAKGGSSELANLRLLCRNCNQRHAIEAYGQRHMSRFLREPRKGYEVSSG